MLKRTKYFIGGVIFTLVLMCVVTANTDDIFKEISVIYDNIKIVINGEKIHTTDVTGKEVEPFIYDGTTYVPIRAVSEAFGKNVEWQSESKTVVISDSEIDENLLATVSLVSDFSSYYINLYSDNKLTVAQFDAVYWDDDVAVNNKLSRAPNIRNEKTYTVSEDTASTLIDSIRAAYFDTTPSKLITGFNPVFTIYIWLKTESSWVEKFSVYIKNENGDYVPPENITQMIDLFSNITKLEFVPENFIYD